MTRRRIRGLASLARMYGAQTAFYDVNGRRQQASPEALLLVLRALGAPVESFADVVDALRERRRQLWERGVEPVVVAWNGQSTEIDVRLPAGSLDGTARCNLSLETEGTRDWDCEVADWPPVGSALVDGVRYVTRRFSLPGRLPWGYHRLTLQVDERQFETLVISAPVRAYAPSEGPGSRGWGVFLPLYALHSRRSWGAGDLADLESLADWVAELGGRVVATLPLLASYLDEPLEPSPYVPVSRLFLNELYIDVTRIPELERCPAARGALESAALQRNLQRLRREPLVDYRRQMALKRGILEELARCFFDEPSERRDRFARFVEAHPLVEDYARFRATAERQRSPWPTWPHRLRDGRLQEGDCDEATKRYHLYVQWLAHEQLRALSTKAHSAGVRLYLDLPLGVHPNGYDVWRERVLFARGASAGAPPDPFFTKGQNWGFPPLHPESGRRQGYRYLIECLRHHLRYAGVLRIDHVMGLHRLYWIPGGMAAHKGVYVRYPWEELYAILSVESHRHEALIVGEDLGTVPGYVRSEMARHNLHRMYVVPFELAPEPRRALGAVPAASVASLNTHDMPPFAAFWRGLLDDRGARTERKSLEALKKALLSFLRRKGLLKETDPDERDIVRACLALLAASRAQVVLVSLEDLWSETKPHNVPGTTDERPNWRRKARHTLEEIRQSPEIIGALREIDALRK
jgi:4-alpha-glucanotransferase